MERPAGAELRIRRQANNIQKSDEQALPLEPRERFNFNSRGF